LNIYNLGKKIIHVKILKKIIFPYSPKNNKAKAMPLYSVLNPETNSLSPSAKSKGERFVSAIIEIIHIIKIGNIYKFIKLNPVDITFTLNLNLSTQGKKIITIRAIS